jgi:hypothetical protein
MSHVARWRIPVEGPDSLGPPLVDLPGIARDVVAVLADQRFGEGNWTASDFVIENKPRPTSDTQGYAYHGTAVVTERASTS